MTGRHAPIVLPMSQSEDVLLCIHVLFGFSYFLRFQCYCFGKIPIRCISKCASRTSIETRQVNELNMELVDKGLEQHPVVLLRFGSEW
jgi:hypothetical protein